MNLIYRLQFYCHNWRLVVRRLLGQPACINVGEYTYGVPAIRWWGEKAGLRIGKYCSIAKNVTIFLGGNHRVDWITTYPFSVFHPWKARTGPREHPHTRGDVVVGNDVWLGEGCLILSGVTIGDGAVVAGRAVVTRDVPPYAIVAGNPARLVKHRFSEEQVQALLDIAWWKWDPSRIAEHLDVLLSGDVEGFIRLARAAPAAARVLQPNAAE